MVRIYCLLIGYVFGLFQTAYIYGKAHGIDIREHGSGNAGTTNALRVLGRKAGLMQRQARFWDITFRFISTLKLARELRQRRVWYLRFTAI